MSRIETKNRGYEMVYGRDHALGLFIEIRDRSLPEEVNIIIEKDQTLHKDSYTEDEFIDWMIAIADEYDFKLSFNELALLKE